MRRADERHEEVIRAHTRVRPNYYNWVFTTAIPIDPNLVKYHIHRAAEMPATDVIFVQTNEPSGPFGAKSVSEISIDGVAPAIASATQAFLEKRYGVKVVVGTHPIPKNYLDMHTSLGTWKGSAWQPRLEATLVDDTTRKAYD
jgi:hypothetical protein